MKRFYSFFLGDNITNTLLVFLMSFSSVLTLVAGSVRLFISNTYKIDALFVYGLLGLLILLAIPQILRRVKVSNLLIISAIFCVFVASVFFRYHDTDLFMAVLPDIVIRCIPMFIVATTVKNHENLFTKLHMSAYVIVFAQIGNVTVFNAGMLQATYSQYIAYLVLPATCILVAALFRRFNIADVIVAIISMIFLLMTGARGPVVIAISFVFAMICLMPMKKIKKVSLGVVFVGAIVVVVLFYREIALFLISVSEELNFSTRIFQKILEGGFLDSSGRDAITEHTLELIRQHPMFGVGMLNERVYIANELNSFTDVEGFYPHNIFLELLVQFGIPIGTVLIGALFALLGIQPLLIKSVEKKRVFLLFLFIGLLPLFVSASYLNSVNFYLLLGFSLNSMKFRYKTRERIIYDKQDSEEL